MPYPVIIPFGIEGGVHLIFTDDALINVITTSVGGVLGTKKNSH